MSTWPLTKGVFFVQHFTSSDRILVLVWDFELPSEISQHILGKSIYSSKEILSLLLGVVMSGAPLEGHRDAGGGKPALPFEQEVTQGLVQGWLKGHPSPVCASFLLARKHPQQARAVIPAGVTPRSSVG